MTNTSGRDRFLRITRARIVRLGIVALTALFYTCISQEQGKRGNFEPYPAGPNEQVEPAQQVLAEPETPPPDYLTIVATGDNLFHDVLFRPPPANQVWDFTPYYREIKPLVQRMDIAFVNQETILAGKDFGYSTYPLFSTPQEAGLALVDTGFTVINHAANHIMDKGEKAVLATMDFWDTMPGTAYLGIFRSQEERDTRRVIIEKNNMKIGFLAYTYGTNGIAVPRDKPYLIALINREIMAKEIEALRPLCDYLIVSMHWGEEYTHKATTAQESLGTFLAEQGVDLVIGHHPHVIQPVVSLPKAGGGTTLCFYSLGNLISAMNRVPALLGGLMYVRLKQEGSILTVESAGLIPVITHYEQGYRDFQIIPLDRYTSELAARHGAAKPGAAIQVDYFKKLATEVWTDRVMGIDISGGPVLVSYQVVPGD